MNTSNPRAGMTFYQKLLIVIAVILIIVGLWYAFASTPATTDDTQTAATSTSSILTASSTATTQITPESYTNTAHLYQVAYTSDWEMTNAFNVGQYAGAVAFVPVASEATIASEIQPNSASIMETAEDHAIFFRIVDDTSINAVVSMLYGNGVVVSNAVINGKNIAHIVHSKSSDPTNWQGGSTEAYIFRNTLGEAVVVEANYSTPEPQSSGPLYNELQTMVSSMTLLAQ